MSTRHLVYVDGQEGTTGLKIHEMLAQRRDLEVLRIAPDKRKDPAERARLINAADLVFLCLPDAASQEACNMVANPNTRLVDASTAFRTRADWVYGLPELAPGHRERIRSSKRVANPGCHATAFILLVRPLVDAGLIAAAHPITATSITGFSGGGKKMIEDYEAAFGRTLSTDARKAKTVGASYSASPGSGSVAEGLRQSTLFENEFAAPRPYALGLAHKHLPEMTKHGGLAQAPLFMPIVGPFFQGLTVSVPLLGFGAGFGKEAQACLAERYSDEPFIQVRPLADPDTITNGFFNSQRCNNTNRADLFVFQNESGQVLLMACIDNLGKGASGAAVQNMNLMLGLPERAGLAVV